MRRLDFHPQRKLRNPARHLRAMARWPQRIAGQLPSTADLANVRYWNFKVQAYSKLIEPPHATPETQRACLAAIFAAAEAVEGAPNRPANCRVACLVTTPFLFQSEVTLFPDEDYFLTFAPVTTTSHTDYDGGWIKASPVDRSILAPILPPAPSGLELLGGTRLVEFDAERGGDPVSHINWVWAYPRR